MLALDRAISRLLALSGVRESWVPTRAGRARVLSLQGRGTGHPVILLHGLGALSQDYALLMHRLRPHVRSVHAVDLPGHGGSEALALHARGRAIIDAGTDAIAQISPSPAVVVGNSLGGLVGLHQALRAPSSVAALILLSPAGAPLDSATRAQLVRRFSGSSSDTADTLERVFDGRRPLHGLMSRTWHRRLATPGLRRILAELAVSRPLDPSTLAQLKVPTLLLWGQRERILPPENLRFFQQHLPPHAVIEQPAGWTHAPFVDHLQDVTVRIADVSTGRRGLPLCTRPHDDVVPLVHVA